MVINATGSITVSSATSEINIGGDWTNSGTFTHGSSTITFDAVSGTKNITAGASPFYNLVINSSGGATFGLGGNLDVNNNLTITKGTLDVLTRDITVAGNWLVDGGAGGILNPQNRTVTFDGVNQSINGGTFYDFVTSGSGTKTIASNLDINRDVTIGAGTT